MYLIGAGRTASRGGTVDWRFPAGRVGGATDAASAAARFTRPMGTGHEELMARLADALERGAVDPRDVERLLAEGRRRRRTGPGAPAVLGMLGAVVVFCGLAIAFGTVFEDLPEAAQVVAPFAFPAGAVAGHAWLARRGSARWQTDLVGLVAYAAFAGACAASAVASGIVDTGRGGAVYVLVAALPAVAVVAALQRAARSTFLLWTGGPVVPAAVGIAVVELAGVLSESTLPWVVLAEAGVAAAAGALMIRAGRADGRFAFAWAALGGYAAVLTTPDDLNRFQVWHVILAVVVVATFLTADALDFGGLIWVAAAGGALWVVLIAIVVGSATGAALAVVLAGAGLLGLGLLVARLRRPPPRSFAP